MDLKMEVYSPGLELLGMLEIQRSVIWEEKAFSSGSFSVESLITDESLALLRPENIIWIEGETAGIIEYVYEESGQDGPYIAVKGYTLTGILDRRILWGRYDLKGTVPDIMCTLVDDCAIHPTRGDVEARKIPGLVLLNAPGGGETVRIQKTGGTLLEALEQLGETYGVAFGVRFNPAVPQMEFWTRWGQNRSIHQTTNEPVFYSTELDDVLASEYSYNSQGYRNVSLVAGEGEGNDRVYVTVENEVEGTPDTPAPQPPIPPTPEKYTVTLSVDPAGGGVASGGKTVAAGVSVTVTAVPAEDYKFVGWQENGSIVSTNKVYTFTVTGDRNLMAVFAAIVPTYTVTVLVDPSGTGTVTGAGQYQEGESVTVKAVAADGYTFARWTADGVEVGTGDSYTFTITGDVEITAAFKEKVSRLPVGYTEVEYVQSNTACGFSTGITINTSTFHIILDLEFGESNGYFAETIFGASFSGYYNCYMKRQKLVVVGVGYITAAGGSNLKVIDSTFDNERVQIDLNCTTGKFKMGNYELDVSHPNVTSTGSLSLLRKTANDNGLLCKIYSAKIYSGEDLQRDFVPCANPDGTVGLYDLVGGVFYKSTWNTFEAGPPV